MTTRYFWLGLFFLFSLSQPIQAKPCAFQVESAQALTSPIRSLVFHLRTHLPDETITAVGHRQTAHGSNAAATHWTEISAVRENPDDENLWTVTIPFPPQFNYSSLTVAFYVRTASGREIWINKDGRPFSNFTIDFNLFYLIQGYGTELEDGEAFVCASAPPFVKQFNPDLCRGN